MSSPKGKVFVERINPALSKAMGHNAQKVFDHINSVMNNERIMKPLEAIHPGLIVFFGDKENSADQAPLYTLLDCPVPDIKRAIRDTGIVQSSWAHANKPLYWVLMLYIRECINRRNVEGEKIGVLFMATAMYAGLQFRYFRRFYNANAMMFARNTLTDKFTLKQEGTMLRTIMAIAWRSHEKYIDDLKNASDQDLLKYLVSMWGRLNGMVKALKNHYEDVKTSGAYLNSSNNRYDDGELVDHETDSGRVSVLSDSISEAFFGESTPTRLIDLAGRMTEVPKQNLTIAVDAIRGGDPKPIREAIHLIIELFFDETKSGRDGIKTRNFIAHSMTVYTRSNTADGRVDRLKEILNNLLAEHSPHYLRTNRDATKGLFRKALYLILVLFIQNKA